MEENVKTISRKLKNITLPTFLFFVIVSCVTINIYFPAAAIEKVADEIVEEVWGEVGAEPNGQEGETIDEQSPDEPHSFLDNLSRYASIRIGVREAHAEEADINVSTPAIRALKKSIQHRAVAIKPYLGSGNAGISNDGLLAIRSTEGLGLKERANLKRLLKAENTDRESLYSEIAKANEFSPDKVQDIKLLFAKSWIKNARPGWWVQDAEGTWSKK